MIQSLVSVLNVGVLIGGYSFTVVVMEGASFSHSLLFSFFTAGATSSPLSPLYNLPFLKWLGRSFLLFRQLNSFIHRGQGCFQPLVGGF
ncbi:MAG: hypothetical protein RLZZ05_203, partial [Bacteroidota bacterium]